MVWRPWRRSTLKLMTVSQRGLGAMRTLVRSSMEKGIVIMVVQPSNNSTHNTLLHYLGSPPAFQHLSQKAESIPYRGCRFYGVGRKKENRRWKSKTNVSRPP